MPDYNSQNVLVGLGTLKVDGTSIGYTSGGVTISLATDRTDKEVDQSFAAVGIIKVRESFTLKTNLAEATLENLKLIWEQAASIVVTGAGIGVPPKRKLKWGQAPAIIEHTLEFVGRSPEGYTRTFSVFKAVVFEVGDLPHQKDAITTIPVTFRILPDVSKPAGEEYGEIIDVTGTEGGPSVFDTPSIVEDVTLSVV